MTKPIIILIVIIIAFVLAIPVILSHQSTKVTTMLDAKTKPKADQLLKTLSYRSDLAVATFAGGCFWCMEGPFEQTEGVTEVISGYAGGSTANPSYDQVASGQTNYRETVQIYYDPTLITYHQLLDKYWQLIDPVDAGGQYVDRGHQYTTAIFYHHPTQKQLAERSKQDLNQSDQYSEPIVTEILEFTNFYPAEEYHQDFYLHSAERYQQYKKGSGRQ